METLLENLDKDFALFEQELDEQSIDDYTGVVERLERLRAPLEYAWGIMSHLTGVKNSDPLRDAHKELQVQWNVFLLVRKGWYNRGEDGGG